MDTKRRTVLRTLGTASAILGLGSANSVAASREICIFAASDKGSAYPYSFAVDGEVEKSDTSMADIDDEYVTSDPEDDIDGCGVHGGTAGGYDCYRFSGDILAFSVPESWVSKYRVWVDGEQVSVGGLITEQDPAELDCTSIEEVGSGGSEVDDESDSQSDDDSGFDPLDSELFFEVYSEDASEVEIDVEVSGQLELPSGERLSRYSGTVQGFISHASSGRIPFSGNLTHLALSEHTLSVSVEQQE